MMRLVLLQLGFLIQGFLAIDPLIDNGYRNVIVSIHPDINVDANSQQAIISNIKVSHNAMGMRGPVNNTSVRKYWKILFYPPNTDTGTFYGGSTDIDTDAQYPKYSTDILVFPVFYSISILCFKPLIDSCY